MDLAPTQAYEDECLPTQRITYGVNEEEEVEEVGVLMICSVPYSVHKGINEVGRHPDCDIVLNNETVSKYHAEIEAGVGPGSTFICDLASSNKTKLNNLFLRPQRAYELKDGDCVKFGQVSAVYRVCRLNESTIPETPAPKNLKKIQCVIPSTPDSSLEESTACSENASIIDDSHVLQDGKNDIFRRPSLPLQRNSAGSSKSFALSTDIAEKSENSHVPVARKISMRDSDSDISEMETQEFSDFNSRREYDIHKEETQRFPVNDVVQRNSEITVQAGDDRDTEKTDDVSVQNEESIHDIETQSQSRHVEESIHDLETQNFEFAGMPRRSKASYSREEDIHDLETQKVDVARIRQRVADDSVDDEEQNDKDDIHDFETQRIDLPRTRQQEANDALDVAEENDIHDFEMQNIDVVRSKEKEAKSSADNENRNDKVGIFGDERQSTEVQKTTSVAHNSQNENTATAIFDMGTPKNVVQKELSQVEHNCSDLETKDTENETAQMLANQTIKSTDKTNNAVNTNGSSLIDNLSEEKCEANETSVSGSQDLLKGYVEEAYFSSDDMPVKQSTPERPSTSNADVETNLERSSEISDNEESVFDAPTQCVNDTTKVDGDSETDEEGVFQENPRNEGVNSRKEIEEVSGVRNEPTSFSDDSETDEEGHFVEMASREEESSIVEKIQSMSDRDDSAESVDIFEAATQKVAANTKPKKVEASSSNELDAGFDVEFPDGDIFCTATQNVNNTEENTNEARENNSRSEERITAEKSDTNADGDKDNLNMTPTQIIDADLSDLQVAKCHRETIPTDVNDTAPTQLMEFPEPQSRGKDQTLFRPTTSETIAKDFYLLPTQIIDENLNDAHVMEKDQDENIGKNSCFENKGGPNHKVNQTEEGSSKLEEINTVQLVEDDEESLDSLDKNNAALNVDTSSVKGLNIEKQEEKGSCFPDEANVTRLEAVHMEIDETLPSHLIHMQTTAEKENTSSDRLSTSMERNEIMNSTALDDHSIRDIIGVPRGTSLSPGDASVEDLEYELAPTQLISEVEKAAEEKSRNVSTVKPNRRKTKESRRPCRVNLNDTIERNLNDMFEGMNEGHVEEPQQMSTQHLEKVLQASQDNSMSKESSAADDVVLARSPSIGGKRRKKSKIVKARDQDNPASSPGKNLSSLTLEKKDSQDSSDSALSAINNDLTSKDISSTNSQKSNDFGLNSINKSSSSKSIANTDSQESSTSSQEINRYFSHLTTRRKRNVIRESQNSENVSVNAESISDERESLKNIDVKVENKHRGVYQDTSDKDCSRNGTDKIDKYSISGDESTSEMGRKKRKSNSSKSARVAAGSGKKSGNKNADKSQDTESPQDEEKKESKIITSSDDSQNSTISNLPSKRNLRKVKASGMDLKVNVPESPTREEGHNSQDLNRDKDVGISKSISESNLVTISNVSNDSQNSGISQTRPKRNLRRTRASEKNKEDTPVNSRETPTVPQSEDIKENEGTEGIANKGELQKRSAVSLEDEDLLAGLPAVTIYGTASTPGSPSASSTSTVHEIQPSSRQTKAKSRGRKAKQNNLRRTPVGIDEAPFRVVRIMDSPSIVQRSKNRENYSGTNSPNAFEADQEISDVEADDSDEDFRNFKRLANKILSVKGTYANKDLLRKNETEESTKKNDKESLKKNDKVLPKNHSVDSAKNRSDSTMSLRNTRSTRQSSKKVDENTHVFQVPGLPSSPSLRIPESLANEDIANDRKRSSSVLSMDESTSNSRSKRLKKSGTEEKTTPVKKSRSSRRKKSISSSGRDSPSILNYLTKTNSSKNTTDSSSVNENTSESNMTAQSFESNSSSNSQTSEKSVQRGKRKAASTANTSVAEEAGGKKKRNAPSKLETSNESLSSDVASRSENSSPTLSSTGTPTRLRKRISTSMSTTLSPSSVRHKILFTGLSDNEYAKILKGLGGLKVEDPMKCTVLVTDKVRRTLKFLCALAQGTPIVSVAWLNESQAAGYFLDWESFLLKDPAMEAKFGFKLAKSLNKAKQQRLLEGYTIVLTPNVAPPPIPELKSMILACGGKVLTRAPAKWPEKSVIVSSEEDIVNARKFLSKAPRTVTIQSKEFILTGILQQELNFVKNSLQ